MEPGQGQHCSLSRGYQREGLGWERGSEHGVGERGAEQLRAAPPAGTRRGTREQFSASLCSTRQRGGCKAGSQFTLVRLCPYILQELAFHTQLPRGHALAAVPLLLAWGEGVGDVNSQLPLLLWCGEKQRNTQDSVSIQQHPHQSLSLQSPAAGRGSRGCSGSTISHSDRGGGRREACTQETTRPDLGCNLPCCPRATQRAMKLLLGHTLLLVPAAWRATSSMSISGRPGSEVGPTQMGQLLPLFLPFQQGSCLLLCSKGWITSRSCPSRI